MARSTFYRALVVSLSLAALVACDSGGGSPSGALGGLQGKLTALTGKLQLGAGLSGAVQAKVMMLVGKRKIPAKLNAKAKKFAFTNLPAGAKTLLIDVGQGPVAVEFSKSHNAADKLTSLIPDVGVLAQHRDANGNLELDLGAVTLAANGHFTPANNPLAYLDTDGDDFSDWLDDDIDGDGIDNLADDVPWGDDYADWGWDDEVWDEWDADMDGEADWCDDDFDGGDDYWGMDEIDGWDVCAEDDDACWDAICEGDLCLDDSDWCLDFPDDELCALDCLANPDDPACGGGAVVDCLANPDDPACYEDVDCLANPDDPACYEDVDCEANPDDPACFGAK